MNLALTTGALVSKQLNSIIVVSREIKNAAGVIVTQANYNHLGKLLLIAIIVGFVVPIAAVVLLLRQDLRNKKLKARSYALTA